MERFTAFRLELLDGITNDLDNISLDDYIELDVVFAGGIGNAVRLSQRTVFFH
jgi:hypothetical protein